MKEAGPLHLLWLQVKKSNQVVVLSKATANGKQGRVRTRECMCQRGKYLGLLFASSAHVVLTATTPAVLHVLVMTTVACSTRATFPAATRFVAVCAL